MPTRNAHRRPGRTGTRDPITVPAPTIETVPDEEWGNQVKQAERACNLIDRHLDHEARGRLLENLRDFRPQHLCPEQRVQMVSDLYGATRE